MLLSDSNTCTSQPRLEHNHTSTTVHPYHFTAKTGLASSLVIFSLFKIRVGKSSSPFFFCGGVKMPPSTPRGGPGGKGKDKHRVVATGSQRFGAKVPMGGTRRHR